MKKPANPYDKTYAEFLRATAGHKLSVLRDDGHYRHLRIAKPGTRAWSWEIVTWPGHLATAGDIAAGYTFARTSDMVQSFDLPSKLRNYYADGSPGIDLNSWAEKLCGGRSLQVKQYDPDVFFQRVRDALDEHEDYSGEAIAQVQAPVQVQEGMSAAERRFCARAALLGVARVRAESEHDARDWLRSQADVFGQDASWEWDLSVYTHSFVVACYCIDLSVQFYRDAQARSRVRAVVEFAGEAIADDINILNGNSRYPAEAAAALWERIAEARVGIKLLTDDPPTAESATGRLTRSPQPAAEHTRPIEPRPIRPRHDNGPVV